MQVVMMFAKLIWIPLKFTGLWLLFPMLILGMWIDEKLSLSREVSDWFFTILIILYCAYVIYTTLNNSLRLLLRDNEFSILEWIREFRSTRVIDKGITNKNTKVDKGFQANTKDMKVSKNIVTGFFFGTSKGQYITKKENKDGHILIIGGAGSGKSTCIAIPTLSTWKNRVFAIDIKGELSKKSKRKANIFCPTDSKSYGYDPYYMLKRSNNQVQEAREIVLSLIPLKEDVKDPFWIQSAQNLLTAIILYYSSENKSFIETMIAIQSQPVEEMVSRIAESTHEEAKMFNNQFIGMDSKTLAGIFVEVANKTMVFATDMDIKRTLSKDIIIKPQDLENGEDIFLKIEESKLEQWKGLLNLIISQFLRHFQDRDEEKNLEPILFLLDEFPRLGKVEGITNGGLTTLRSKKVHIALLIQSLAQLDVIYGKGNRQIILDNTPYTAILSATDTETQEYFSKRVGTHEKLKTSHNANYEQYTQLGKGTGVSKTTEEKRIIKPEEFAYLKDIVLLTPHGYTRVEKAPYFKDSTIQKKIQKQIIIEDCIN